MWNKDAHLTDEEIIQAADGELSPRREAEIQSHFAGCWQCRTRRTEIEAAITDFVQAHNQTWNNVLPPIDGPRSMLRARLAQLADAEQNNRLGRILESVFHVRRLAYVGLIAGMLVLCTIILQLQVPRVRASFTPDARLTPGVTRASSREDVCFIGASRLHAVPASVAYEVFEKYGIRNPEPRSYEVDYLITPALGGAIDVRNLWPQPYTTGIWNARVKDALEDHLHQLVCAGQLDLSIAQQEISSNWIAAYKKYFATDQPLQAHVSFSKDRPWE